MDGYKTPLHILVMGKLPYPHGMAGTKRVHQFVEKFHQEGHQVMVVLIRQGEDATKGEPTNGTFDGVPYLHIGKDLSPGITFPLRFVRYLREAWQVLRSYRYEKRKVLLYYGIVNLDNLMIIPMAKLMGFKIVFDIVEDVQYSDLDASLKRKLNLLLMKRLDILNLSWCDGLVVISSHLQRKYSLMNRWNRKMVRIPISASIRDDKTSSMKGRTVTLLYAGSYVYKDGVDILIEATSKVAQKHKVRLELLGAGRRMKEYRDKYAHLEEIDFLGYLDDETYFQRLSQADIMCVPRIDSDYAHAGFPYKLGEFLGTGNPVICSETGDIAEFLSDGDNAMLVKPGNLEELVEAITFLIENPQKASEIGQKGQAVCKASFNPDRNSGALVEFVNSL